MDIWHFIQNFLTQRSKSINSYSKEFIFYVSKVSKETCSSPFLLLVFSFFFSHIFPFPSKLHPLSLASCILLHLQPVSSLCTQSQWNFMGWEWSKDLRTILLLNKLNWNCERFVVVGKFLIIVSDWVEFPRLGFPFLWRKKIIMLLMTSLSFYTSITQLLLWWRGKEVKWSFSFHISQFSQRSTAAFVLWETCSTGAWWNASPGDV